MSGAAIAPALAEIELHFKDLPNSQFLVKMILTMPALFIAITAPIMGGVCDKVGRVPVLMFGIALYGISGCSPFLFPGLYSILVGRAFLGIAVACVLTSCTTLIGDFYQGHQRDRMMGLQAAFMSYSGVFFPLASGALADVNWQLPFAVYSVSFLMLPMVYFWIKEPVHHAHTQTKHAEESSFPVWTLLLLFGLAAVYMTCYYFIPAQFPFYLKYELGANALQTGMTLAFVSFSIGSWAMLFHRIRKFIPAPWLAVISLTCICIGFQILSMFGSWIGIGVGIFIAGMGLGTLGPNITTWSLAIAPERLRGRVTGSIAASFFVGQFLSPVLAKPMVDAWDINGAFQGVSLIILTLAIIMSILAIAQRKKA